MATEAEKKTTRKTATKATRKAAPKKTTRKTATKATRKAAPKKTTRKTSTRKKAAPKSTLKARAKRVEREVEKDIQQLIERLGGDNAEAVAKKIWLAGLGAYGRTIDEVQEMFEKISDNSQDLFEELVERGEKLQDVTQSKLKGSRSEMEEKIETAKSKIFSIYSRDSFADKISEVSEKLDSLSKEIRKAG